MLLKAAQTSSTRYSIRRNSLLKREVFDINNLKSFSCQNGSPKMNPLIPILLHIIPPSTHGNISDFKCHKYWRRTAVSMRIRLGQRCFPRIYQSLNNNQDQTTDNCWDEIRCVVSHLRCIQCPATVTSGFKLQITNSLASATPLKLSIVRPPNESLTELSACGNFTLHAFLNIKFIWHLIFFVGKEKKKWGGKQAAMWASRCEFACFWFRGPGCGFNSNGVFCLAVWAVTCIVPQTICHTTRAAYLGTEIADTIWQNELPLSIIICGGR